MTRMRPRTGARLFLFPRGFTYAETFSILSGMNISALDDLGSFVPNVLPSVHSLPYKDDFYRLGYDDDDEFLDQFFKCKGNSRYVDKGKFRPEDIERAGKIIEKSIGEKAKILGIDPDPVRSVVAAYIEARRADLEKELETSLFTSEYVKDEIGRIDRLDPADIERIVFNALYGYYVAKVTGKRLELEVDFDRNTVSCLFLSSGGLRLMNLTAPVYAAPENTRFELDMMTGVGKRREITFSPDELDEKITRFDFGTIFSLCEENMDLAGKKVQEIIVSCLGEVKYSFKSVDELEQELKDMGYYYKNRSSFLDEKDGILPTAENNCFSGLYSYLSDRLPDSYMGDICRCTDTGKNSFTYAYVNGSFRRGKGIELSPFARKMLDDPDFPDVRFMFGLAGDIFEIYVSGLTLRTSPLRGLETLYRLDFEHMAGLIEPVLSKTVLNKKNIDNMLDLEEL